MTDETWCAIVAVADPPPLRSFRIFGGGDSYPSERAAKEHCERDYRRRRKNVLAAFEWRPVLDVGFAGGDAQLTYDVWKETK